MMRSSAAMPPIDEARLGSASTTATPSSANTVASVPAVCSMLTAPALEVQRAGDACDTGNRLEHLGHGTLVTMDVVAEDDEITSCRLPEPVGNRDASSGGVHRPAASARCTRHGC